MPEHWKDAILTPSSTNEILQLFEKVDLAYKQTDVFPPKHQVFNALQAMQPTEVKVVIVGQDPYHGNGQAHGYSFSVPTGVKIPPSLRNIFTEIQQSLQCNTPTSGDLTHWAEQGVLLLNTSLTVESGKAGSHANFGWSTLTDGIIHHLAQQGEIVFMLWGSHAQAKVKLIDETTNLILTAPHPSPLSAYRGFLGCNHFVDANAYLRDKKKAPISWCSPEAPNLFSNL